jgi:hypothetical protein
MVRKLMLECNSLIFNLSIGVRTLGLVKPNVFYLVISMKLVQLILISDWLFS